VIKSHVLYRLSYGLERADNGPSYVGFGRFAQAASGGARTMLDPLV
jgi:hypothetical protein